MSFRKTPRLVIVGTLKGSVGVVGRGEAGSDGIVIDLDLGQFGLLQGGGSVSHPSIRLLVNAMGPGNNLTFSARYLPNRSSTSAAALLRLRISARAPVRA